MGRTLALSDRNRKESIFNTDSFRFSLMVYIDIIQKTRYNYINITIHFQTYERVKRKNDY